MADDQPPRLKGTTYLRGMQIYYGKNDQDSSTATICSLLRNKSLLQRTRRSAPKAAIWRHASYFYCMTIRCFVRRPGNFESGNWEDNYRKLAYHGCPHAGGGCGIEILEYPFGAGNIGTARINRNRLPQRFGERLEYRLGHMVAVGTVGHIHMEIHPRGVGQRPK